GLVAPVGPTPSFSADTQDYYTVGATASQLLWDFTQSSGRWRAAEAQANAAQGRAQASQQQVLLDVRTAFFSARAQKALLEVARDALRNQERHLAQIEGFVKVGARPEIDRAQARTDVANAHVALISAENSYETAKAQLNKAMGMEA